MKHVCTDDEIVGLRLEVLVCRGLFEVQDFVFHLWERREFLICRGEEASGNVGECVSMNSSVEQRQQLCSETRSAGTDFKNSQTSSFWQVASRFLNTLANAYHPVTGEQPVAIEMI